MKKNLRLKPNETLAEWIARLALHFGWSDEEREAVRDVSITSYTHGSNDAIKVVKRTVVVLAIALLTLTSCTTTKIVEVERVRTDTTYITKQQRDSVWLHDSVLVREKGDTVLLERWHTKYIERQVHDTLYKSKTDSVPVPYPVVKMIEKELSTTQKGLMGVGLLSLMAGFVFVVFRLKKFLP